MRDAVGAEAAEAKVVASVASKVVEALVVETDAVDPVGVAAVAKAKTAASRPAVATEPDIVSRSRARIPLATALTEISRPNPVIPGCAAGPDAAVDAATTDGEPLWRCGAAEPSAEPSAEPPAEPSAGPSAKNVRHFMGP